MAEPHDAERREVGKVRRDLGPSADLFLATFRRTPTANAEGLDRMGGDGVRKVLGGGRKLQVRVQFDKRELGARRRRAPEASGTKKQNGAHPWTSATRPESVDVSAVAARCSAHSTSRRRSSRPSRRAIGSFLAPGAPRYFSYFFSDASVAFGRRAKPPRDAASVRSRRAPMLFFAF